MKNLYLLFAATTMLMAGCQNKDDISSDGALDVSEETARDQERLSDPNFVPIPAAIKVPLDGKITLSPEPLVSENAACILPLRVSNGADVTVSVSMFSFKVTGSGNADTGNMFAQPVPSGEARTARVILIGQSCSAFDTLTAAEVLCVSGDVKCPAPIEFESSGELTLIGPN